MHSGDITSTIRTEVKLAFRCVGALHYFLKTCLLDIQIFSLGKFVMYVPPVEANEKNGKFMLMDGNTMHNLHLLGGSGTLQHNLDHCCTPIGKRLLKHWICHPLYDINEIKERLEAVTAIRNAQCVNEIREMLKTVPDLERCLAQ